MDLGAVTRPELIFVDLPGSDQPTVLKALARRLVAAGVLDDARELYRRLVEREGLGSTAIGSGVAIPHCKMRRLREVVMAVGITEEEIDFNAADGSPVRLFFLLVSPEEEPAAHLQSLSAISRWVKADRHVERILELKDPAAIFELLRWEST